MLKGLNLSYNLIEDEGYLYLIEALNDNFILKELLLNSN